MSKTIRAPLALAVALVWGLGATQLASAATTVTLRQADLIAALSDTRSEGHVTFLTDGLHVQTDDTSSEAKAAEYWQTGGALPTSGSLTWFGTDAQPSMQLVFDFDATTGNGNDFNILVGEPHFYGDNWWLTPGSSADAKAVDPSGGNNSGNGSEWFGTLAQWETAMPAARFLAGGFSLGSGVKGDGVIDSITYGDIEYRFTNGPASGVANVTGSYTKEKDGRQVKVFLTSDAQPANTTLGNKLVWKVKVDGNVKLRAEQGFSDYDKFKHKFAANSGKHTVKILKNGTLVKTIEVKT